MFKSKKIASGAPSCRNIEKEFQVHIIFWIVMTF